MTDETTQDIGWALARRWTFPTVFYVHRLDDGSIHVRWHDGPSREDVDGIVSRRAGGAVTHLVRGTTNGGRE